MIHLIYVSYSEHLRHVHLMFTFLSNGCAGVGNVGKFSIQNMGSLVPFFGIFEGFFETR